MKRFLKLGHPRPLFHLFFGLSKQTSTRFLQQYNVKNVHPVSGAGIWNAQPLERESPPITTRPGLQPNEELFAVAASSIISLDRDCTQLSRGANFKFNYNSLGSLHTAKVVYTLPR